MEFTKPFREQMRTLSVMSVLLAMVMQLTYLPFHLAYEEHSEGHESSAAHFAAVGLVSEGGHAQGLDHGHDHDEQDRDSHPCHSVQDHRMELMVPSASSAGFVAASHAILAYDAWSPPALKMFGWSGTSSEFLASTTSRFRVCPRGPPAAV